MTTSPTTLSNQTVSGAVTLDGAKLVNCVFENATLTYSGGVPPHIENCHFNQTTFAFEGPAGQTLSFLRGMAPAGTNMRFIVEGLIPELKA